MGRWAPDAQGRLVESALTLYQDRGFDQTTVAEIADLSGLTERTFFRHFTDKREVLFAGATVLFEVTITAIAAAPPGTPVLDLVAAGLGAAAEVVSEDRAFSVRRHAVITANPELHERELSKLAALAGAVAEALVARGIAQDTSTLAAETGIALFKVAYDRWVTAAGDKPLPELVDRAIDELRAVAATA